MHGPSVVHWSTDSGYGVSVEDAKFMGSLHQENVSYSVVEAICKSTPLICSIRQIDHTRAVPKSNMTLSVSISHPASICKHRSSQCSLQRVAVRVSLWLVRSHLAQHAVNYV